MPILIDRALYEGFGGTLETRVAGFAAALDAHRLTEGVPAPVEDPLVEMLARSGAAFEVVEPPPPPDPPPVPEPPAASLTRRQLRLWLAVTQQIPLTGIEAAIDALPEPDRTVARIEWADATLFLRGHPLIDQIGAALGLTPEQIDQGFIDARNLWP